MKNITTKYEKMCHNKLSELHLKAKNTGYGFEVDYDEDLSPFITIREFKIINDMPFYIRKLQLRCWESAYDCLCVELKRIEFAQIEKH